MDYSTLNFSTDPSWINNNVKRTNNGVDAQGNPLYNDPLNNPVTPSENPLPNTSYLINGTGDVPWNFNSAEGFYRPNNAPLTGDEYGSWDVINANGMPSTKVGHQNQGDGFLGALGKITEAAVPALIAYFTGGALGGAALAGGGEAGAGAAATAGGEGAGASTLAGAPIAETASTALPVGGMTSTGALGASGAEANGVLGSGFYGTDAASMGELMGTPGTSGSLAGMGLQGGFAPAFASPQWGVDPNAVNQGLAATSGPGISEELLKLGKSLLKPSSSPQATSGGNGSLWMPSLNGSQGGSTNIALNNVMPTFSTTQPGAQDYSTANSQNILRLAKALGE